MKYKVTVFYALTLLGLAMSLYGGFIGICVLVVAKCFEYSLWAIFGKDVAWYLDVAGGLVLNGLNIPIAILCLIARACGVPVPFYQ